MIDSIIMVLASNLRAILKRHDLTLSALSREVKIPVATLSGWVNGQSPRGLGQVKKLADYFGLTIDELCFAKTAKQIQNPEHLNAFLHDEPFYCGRFEVFMRKIEGHKD